LNPFQLIIISYPQPNTMEQPTIARENLFESILVSFHNVATPMLIPVLEPIPSDKSDKSDKSEEEETKAKDPFTYDFNLFKENPEMKFGILELQMADTPILSGHQVLDTNVDMSGSMDDDCADGKTKMQHAKHTLKNIITSLSKTPEASVSLTTYGFDDKVEKILEDEQITPDSANRLRETIDKNLQSRGGTNIYDPLKHQSARASANHEQTPNLRQMNITLTDGIANQGIVKYSEIATQVAENCANIFIGFGSDHDANGLQQLADAQPNGSYFFVAEIEKAALVFGEVIHQMLYTSLINITISVENGEIYDYKTNAWQTSINVDSIVSEAKKTYHLRSTTPEKTYVDIIAQSLVHNDQEASPFDLDDLILCKHPEEVVDLTINMFRQRTQELIFKAHKHSTTQPTTRDGQEDWFESTKSIRKELVNFIKFMSQYSKENSLEECELLNNFITDLVVITKTFGGPRASLYSATKRNSQGRQTSNNTNYIDPRDIAQARQQLQPQLQPILFRQNALGVFPNQLFRSNSTPDDPTTQLDDFDLDTIGNLPTPPTLSRGLTRTYTTPRQATLMRSLTGDTQSDDLDSLTQPQP